MVCSVLQPTAPLNERLFGVHRGRLSVKARPELFLTPPINHPSSLSLSTHTHTPFLTRRPRPPPALLSPPRIRAPGALRISREASQTHTSLAWASLGTNCCNLL